MSRVTWFVAAAAVVAVSLPFGAAGGVGASKPLLPDLGVAPIQDVLIEQTQDGKRIFRFSTRIANVGAGPIELVAKRPSLEGDFTVFQRIRRANGTSFLRRTSAPMIYAGAVPHAHWHLKSIVRYELRRLGTGSKVWSSVKRDFCFYDESGYRPALHGAPRTSFYARKRCEEQPKLQLTTGISVGWLDLYHWSIPGQDLDATRLPKGRYRLLNTVDPKNWFRERNERNNTTWVDVEIGDSLTVEVVGRSPRV